MTHEEYLGAGGELSYPPGGFDSIELGEADVQQNQIRFQFFGLLNGF